MFDKMTYLDNSASTRLDERVMDAMKPYYFDTYAVATSEFGYSMGIDAKEGLQEARETIASSIGATPEEIVFTSGETESSNMAIKGVVAALKKKKGEHIIVSKLEDFAVLNTAKNLEKQGYNVDYISVDAEGILDLEELKSKIRDDTVLVSIQHANQEIGTLQNLDAIAKICREKEVLFHTDATHSYTRVPIDVSKTPIDLISMSAHTIHGPRGVGALYVRKGTPLIKWMDGGYQETDRRAGLENIPGAVGFAKAVELVTEKENEFLTSLRDYTIKRVFEEIPHVTLNGSKTQRTPQNANITFHYVEGESMTLHLDMRGFAVSTGSACFSRSLEASHVILGIGGDHERAHGSIRFTFGRYNSMEDVDAVVDAIKEIVSQLRAISPLYNKEE
ncbi:cysteine desulfurase family protein [Methanolobus vulcani]|uniref:Cysteine desulfurase n=1 Tax=Methanolobus vulcani TaxID=38026 RepID=A0A7Z8KNT3_9EURY|nr:cysteine desulfurase family protein [Methanolobus vulcani]TQD25909.1 cysteine desulfurase [Methanolobus vulcani]